MATRATQTGNIVAGGPPVLNIGRLAAGGEGYYLDSVATGVEDYYTGDGEAPGHWLTEAAAGLGLTGVVDAEALRQVMAGDEPRTGNRLLRTSRRRVPGFDLAFRAPKSVSLLLALGDEATTAIVRDAHDQAVRASIEYLERFAARSRRGRAHERLQVEGLVAAAFRHRTSRAGDPLLHTHVLVANMARCSDGDWRTLDSPVLHIHAKTAGFLYQAALREQLSRRLGVEWTAVRNGTAEIAGVPAEVIRAFSQRRVEIEVRMAEMGGRSAKAAQAATLDTRQAKAHIHSEHLTDAWRRRAADLGFGLMDVSTLLGVSQADTPTPGELAAIAERLAGPTGLTARASTFTRRDVVRAWCEQLQAGATVEEVLRLADTTLHTDSGLTAELITPDTGDPQLAAAIEQVVAALATRISDTDASALGGSEELRASLGVLLSAGRRPEQIVAGLLQRELDSADAVDAVLVWRAQQLAAGHREPGAGVERGAVIRRGDGRAVRADHGERRYSTPELLALEQRLVEQAVARRGTGAAVVAAEHIDLALDRRPSVSGEQASMIRRLLTSGNGVEVVVGKAGAGKTFALDAAREAWQAAGVRVVGAALAARAAAELHAGAGIDAYTIDALLSDLDRTQGRLAKGTVVVVDEAAMVGTRKLARLLDHVERVGGKVVLVGDHRQLPEIDAGGVFRGLLHRLDPIRLDHNRRQRQPWERAALDELRSGNPAAALGAYGDHDQLVIADTADAVRERLVEDWWHAYRTDGAGCGVMIAARRSDVDDLNARARTRLHEHGMVTGPALVVGDTDFRPGDRVVALNNDRRVGVLNGTRGTVTHVDAERRTLLVSGDDGRDHVLPAAYLDAGHLAHAYALTAHKAQGLTTDRTWVLGSDEIYREWGYVAMSRGRDSNRMYVVAAHEEPDLDVHSHVHQPPGDRVAELARALERSRAQTLAIDLTTAASTSRAATRAAARDRLLQLLTSAPADPEQQLEWIAEERDAATAQLEAAQQRLAATRELAAPRERFLRRRGVTSTPPDAHRAEADIQRWQSRLSDIARREEALRAAHDSRQAWLDRHDVELRDAAGLVQRGGADVHRRAQAAEFAAPHYLMAAIGERPGDPAGRRAWRAGALAIESYRARYGIDDPLDAFGPAPESTSPRLDYEQARSAAKAVTAAREMSMTHVDQQHALEGLA